MTIINLEIVTIIKDLKEEEAKINIEKLIIIIIESIWK